MIVISQQTSITDSLTSDARLLFKLVQYSGDYCYEIRFSKGEVNKTAIAGNFHKVTGYTADELQQMPDGFKTLVHPDDLGILESAQLNEWEEFSSKEYRIIRKDGEERWLKENIISELNSVTQDWIRLGWVRDITHEKEVITQALQSESRHKALLEALPDLMFLYNRDGVFIDCHIPEGQTTLVPREVFANKSVDEVLPEYLATLTKDKINELLETGESQYYQYEIDDGLQKRVFESRMVICGKDDFLAIVRDITVEKKQQDEIERVNEELKRFTYTVSHDLRSPLISIKSFADFLEKDLISGRTDRLKTHIDFIRFSVHRMNDLLEGLLELSRIGRKSGNWQPVRLSEIIEQTRILLMAPLNENNIELVLPEKDLLLKGDVLRLSQVFQNLLENAIKFKRANTAPKIELGWEFCNGEICIFIRDNGRGIQPRFLNKIFDLFHKLDPQAKGTGLGLTIVKRIVEIHGGKVWAFSEGLEKGSTFWFTLPGIKVID
ncbi:MAG: PAS domain S-box protein [Cyclobacteriaceae bacterium]|nr:PAS domain S-box protein [Cyclobacteriaceae bacterium]